MRLNTLLISIAFLLTCCSMAKVSKHVEQKADIDTILRLTLLFPDTISGFEKNIPIKLELRNTSNQVLFVNNPSYMGITYLSSKKLIKSSLFEPDFDKIYSSFIKLNPNEVITTDYSLFLDELYYIHAGLYDLSLVYCGKIKNEKGIFINYKDCLKSNSITFYIKPDRLLFEWKKKNKISTDKDSLPHKRDTTYIIW